MSEKMPGFNDYKDFLTKVGHGTVDDVDVTHDGYPLSTKESRFISLFVANGRLNKCLREAGMTMKDLAGKDSVFAVTVKEVREPKAIEINDELAKSLGAKSLDNLKETLSARIKADYDKASRMKLKRQLLDILDKEYKFDVMQAYLEIRCFSDFEERVKERGENWDDDINIYKGYDWDDYGREMFSSCGYDREIPENLQDFFDFEAYGKYLGDYYVHEYSEGLIEIY